MVKTFIGAKLKISHCFVAAVLTFAHQAHAFEFDLSGFASFIGGKTFGKCADATITESYLGTCTRNVADFAHAGVYTSHFSMEQESKIGLQGTANFTKDFSATMQIVGRLVSGAHSDLEWAYLTYNLTPSWTLQLGRKRIPFLSFSDIQDVGYAYTPIRFGPEVYGWDMVNYNGINVLYKGLLGGWAVKSNIFWGSEKSKNNPLVSMYYADQKTIEWTNLRGADLEINRSFFTGRLVYILSNVISTENETGEQTLFPWGVEARKHKFYGAAVNIDLDPLIINSEYIVADRSQYLEKSKSWSLGIGYRIGRFTPYISFTDYRESTPFADYYIPAKNNRQSFTLRYEVTTSSALKVQYDQYQEKSELPFLGDAKMISASYDIVF